MQDQIQAAITHFQLKVTGVQTVNESHSSIVRILTLADKKKVVLKIPFTADKLSRELAVLKLLQEKLPVPRLLDSWLGEAGQPGALLLSFIPGEPVTGPISPELAFELGALLAALHTHRLERFGDDFQAIQNWPQGWWASLDENFQSWQPFCASFLTPELFHKTLERYAELFAHLPEPDGPCLVHFDYRPGNVLIQDGQIIGLIDFESARSGSADLDFTKIKGDVWEQFPGTQEAFIKGYTSLRPLPPIEQTLPFYELYHTFGGVAWCLRRGRLDDPFLSYNLERLKLILDKPAKGL